MSKSPRKIVCRDFKKAEGIFLNYNTQEKVELGDIFVWDGKEAQFNIVTRLSEFGISVPSQRSLLSDNRLYTSGRGVTGKFRSATANVKASMNFGYSAASRYSLQASETVLEELDEVALASAIIAAEKARNLSWNKDWIVVAKVWDAASYTKFVSAHSNAYASVEASTSNLITSFNIADVDLGIGLSDYSGLASHQFAEEGARPFFMGMKLRRRAGAIPYMAKYG